MMASPAQPIGPKDQFVSERGMEAAYQYDDDRPEKPPIKPLKSARTKASHARMHAKQ
jgi:hypothetical protein